MKPVIVRALGLVVSFCCCPDPNVVQPKNSHYSWHYCRRRRHSHSRLAGWVAAVHPTFHQSPAISSSLSVLFLAEFTCAFRNPFRGRISGLTVSSGISSMQSWDFLVQYASILLFFWRGATSSFTKHVYWFRVVIFLALIAQMLDWFSIYLELSYHQQSY